MLNTFIIIAGIAILLIAARQTVLTAAIGRHLDDLSEKTLNVTLELRQLHADLNKDTAQTVASVAAGNVMLEKIQGLVDTTKRELHPKLINIEDTLDSIRDWLDTCKGEVKTDPEAPTVPSPEGVQESPDPVETGAAVAEAIEN